MHTGLEFLKALKSRCFIKFQAQPLGRPGMTLLPVTVKLDHYPDSDRVGWSYRSSFRARASPPSPGSLSRQASNS